VWCVWWKESETHEQSRSRSGFEARARSRESTSEHSRLKVSIPEQTKEERIKSVNCCKRSERAIKKGEGGCFMEGG
jgi:hypothetical protein